MKESDWKECLETNSVIRITPDIERTKSLIETAFKRIKLVKNINIENCNFVFEDYYTSLLELLQALTIKNGYKVLNHLCIGFFIRDILKREDLFIIFDDLRYKRNSLTYYGTRMDLETCKSSIKKSKFLINEIKKIL